MFDYLENYRRLYALPPGAVKGFEMFKGTEAFRVYEYNSKTEATQTRGDLERLESLALFLELKGFSPHRDGATLTTEYTARKAKQAKALINGYIVAMLDEV